MDSDRREAIADELFAAHQARSILPRLTARNPDMTVEDSYAIQSLWAQRRMDAGRSVAGHKIGLTSKAMQAATGITEPDYGVIFDDQVYASGSTVESDAFSNVRIEVELAFALSKPLSGDGCTVDDVLDATEYVVPALEILNSHLELEGRTIVDTIADNAALGAMVVGDVRVAPGDIDLPWVAATPVSSISPLRSRRRASRPACSGIRLSESPGSPESSRSTERVWLPVSSCWPGHSRDRCG